MINNQRITTTPPHTTIQKSISIQTKIKVHPEETTV